MGAFNVRNYTSGVPVGRSVQMIEELLVKAGATHIAKWWDGELLAGVIFQMPVNGIPVTFRLPSKPEALAKVMLEGVKRPRRGTKERMREQAMRTAWKLLYDWVSVQVSMVRMEQAEAVQVFLPYVWDQKSERTFFERIKEGGFRQLNPHTEERKER